MDADVGYGEIHRHDGRSTLRYRRSLTRSQPDVWAALTESGHLRWWMPADMVGERAAGASVRMVFWPDLVEAKGLEADAGTATILSCDPPSVFEWRWHDSLVRFQLAPSDEDGCLLDLAVEIDTDEPEAVVENACGFHLWVDHLSELVETGSSPPIAEGDAGRHEGHYRSVVGLA